MKSNRETRALRPMAESGHKDARLARGARLLGAYGSLPESSERMNRVRRALQSAPEPTRAGWSLLPDLREWLPRPAVAIALLLGLTAVAGATVGRAPLTRAFDEVQRRFGLAPATPTPAAVADSAKARTPRSAPVARAEAPRAPIAPAPAAELVVAAPAPANAQVVPSPSPTVAPSLSPSGTTPPTRHDPAAHAAEAAPAIPSAEATLAHTAMKALRVERDPARASVLLESYLKRYPEGLFVEETLSLWIEALSVQDPVRAALVAATYKRKFPTGPHIDKANAAIAAAPR